MVFFSKLGSAHFIQFQKRVAVIASTLTHYFRNRAVNTSAQPRKAVREPCFIDLSPPSRTWTLLCRDLLNCHPDFHFEGMHEILGASIVHSEKEKPEEATTFLPVFLWTLLKELLNIGGEIWGIDTANCLHIHTHKSDATTSFFQWILPKEYRGP